LLDAPAVIAFKHVGNTDHHINGGKGMEPLAGKQVASGAGLLLLKQGANQGEGSVEDGEQGKRCKALKGSDLPLRSGDDMS
jgi:hypothetical protein